MYPKIFNLIDTYSVMMILGIIVAFIIFILYLNRKNYSKLEKIWMIETSLLTIIIGIFSSNLFQNIYNLIEDPSNFHYSFSGLTFYGGLIGGVISFLLIYFLLTKKHLEKDKSFFDVFSIAPLMITSAHTFGRIGCYCAGCCYGIESSSWMAVKFVTTETTVLPTNLFEAIFLLLLSIILAILIFKKDFKYGFVIYVSSYGLFRFLIEYIRGDYRGSFIPGLTPSQFWSIILILSAIPIYFLIQIKSKNTN